VILALAYGMLGSCAIGAVAIAILHAFARVFPTAGPTVRHRCWTAALIAMAISPVLCVMSVTASTGDIHVTAQPPAPAVLARVHFAAHSIVALPIANMPAALPPPAPSKPSMLAVAAVIWMLVAGWRLARVTVAVARVREIKRGARKLFVLQRPQSRRTRVYVSSAVPGPIMAGYFHPAIVLPQALVVQANDADLQRIVLHELAHIRRCDDWAMLFERIVAALLWFNPAVAYVARRLALERELACDRDVVTRTGSPTCYAQLLWKLAQGELAAQSGLTPAVAPLRSHIALRLQHLLQDRDSAANDRTRLFVAASATMICTIVLGLSAFAAPAFARQHFSRTDFTTVVLRNGNMLVLGGRMSDGRFVRSMQESDARTRTIVSRSVMNVARANATATLLADDTVLITGGWTPDGVTARAEIYYPARHVFSETGAMTYPRAEQSATLLRDGRVAVFGGRAGPARYISTPEFYDPATHRFVRAKVDADERIGLATRLLANGDVLMWGGLDPGRRLKNCAIAFDPVRERFYDVGYKNPIVASS
jgi:beta-lactamase regulating signal transducer with metallopeptidase domain